jgi:hypothetical protein
MVVPAFPLGLLLTLGSRNLLVEALALLLLQECRSFQLLGILQTPRSVQ